MNKILTIALFALFTPVTFAGAATDYFLKLGDIKGEVQTTVAPRTDTRATDSSAGSTQVPTGDAETTIAPPSPETEAKVEIGALKAGASSEPTQVNKVDAINIKQTVQPDASAGSVQMPATRETAGKDDSHKNEIEILSNSATEQANMPDFGILLGGGSEVKGGVYVASGDVNGYSDEKRAQLAAILLQGLEEAGAPVEQVSLNFEKIKVQVRQDLKLFGFIPVAARSDVDVDSRGNATVAHPWWSFLATGKDAELATKVVTVLTTAFTNKYEIITNAIAGDDAASSIQTSMGF